MAQQENLMGEKRPNRSNSYQWVILEFPYDFTNSKEIAEFGTERGLYARVSSEQSQEFQELNDQAIKLVVELITTQGTELQAKMVQLFLEGKKQMEIAKILDCNQSSVAKCFKGNVDYASGKAMRYGGITKKLIGLILKSNELKQLLRKMAEISV